MMTCDPHYKRAQAIVAAHPEIKSLRSLDIVTLYWAVGSASLHVATAVFAHWTGSFTVCILASFFIGAYLDSFILAMIHECSHHLIFATPHWNNLLGIFVNIPLLIPISAVFNQHHREHHLHLGDSSDDVDVPMPFEVKFVGNTPWKKAVYLFFYGVILSSRSGYKLGVKPNKYLYMNWISSIGFGLVMLYFMPLAAVYLVMSAWASLGIHPANARVIQRHVKPPVPLPMKEKPAALKQDGTHVHTFSYYGAWNPWTLNVGFHVEHHDFPRIVWRDLPKIREIAPEFYDCLESYNTRGLIDFYRFVFDKSVTLASLYSQEETGLTEPLVQPSPKIVALNTE